MQARPEARLAHEEQGKAVKGQKHASELARGGMCWADSIQIDDRLMKTPWRMHLCLSVEEWRQKKMRNARPATQARAKSSTAEVQAVLVAAENYFHLKLRRHAAGIMQRVRVG